MEKEYAEKENIEIQEPTTENVEKENVTNEIGTEENEAAVAEKKKRLKKWQKALIVIGSIILAFFLAVFIWSAIDIYNIEKNGENYEPRIEDKELDISKESKDPVVEGEIKSTPISLSAESENAFEEYLKTVVPEYEYSDLYAIEESLALYNKKNIISVEKHTHDVRVNGKLDANKLYELVLKNNEQFFADGKGTKGMYKIPTNAEIKEQCEWICQALEEYAKAYPQIDMDTVCCNLYDLKMFNPISGTANAAVSEKNVFSFNKEQMERNKFIMDTDDIQKTTLYHEVVHLCQIKCDCFNNYGDWRTGINNEYEQVKTDPLCWYWLTEASAEMIESSYLGVQYSTYKSYIGYASSLNYIAQLDENVGAEEVELLNFSADVEEIFKMFDIKTEEERIEFIKMMYTIEVLQMDPEEFKEAYEEKRKETLVRGEDDAVLESNVFAISLKDDAILSMTKLFYRNLARQVARGNTTLEDVYYLMRVWEGKIGYHTACEIYFYNASFGKLYKDCTAIQDEFFKFIAEENDISTDELVKEFESYSMSVQQDGKIKSPNCDLAFFNDAEKQYIEDYKELYYWTGYPSVRENIENSAKCAAEIKAYNETKATEPVTE